MNIKVGSRTVLTNRPIMPLKTVLKPDWTLRTGCTDLLMGPKPDAEWLGLTLGPGLRLANETCFYILPFPRKWCIYNLWSSWKFSKYYYASVVALKIFSKPR